MTADERKRLFQSAASNPEWEHVYCAAIVAANTSMRPVEVKHLRRCDVDLIKRLLHVRRSKNETSQWGRFDATKPMLKWDTAWRALRDEAGLHGLRFHDLRHTVITALAEMGVADHVLESISGHLSRRMLEHYSHIRIDAKRQALDALDDVRRAESNGIGEPANDNEIETIVEVADDLTSQSRHSLLLQGSPPSGKLLIPLNRRDDRVVEGARLESVCRGNSTEGSNPSLSANLSPSALTTRPGFPGYPRMMRATTGASERAMAWCPLADRCVSRGKRKARRSSAEYFQKSGSGSCRWHPVASASSRKRVW